MISMRETQKAEAAERLKLMGVREDVRRKFEEDGTVVLCKDGRYYHCTERLVSEIRQFEEKHDATVFLAVRMLTVFGTLDALLFVGKYEEEWEWELERRSIKDGYTMSYTINRSYPECSEMGSISFRTTADGGIVREG